MFLNLFISPRCLTLSVIIFWLGLGFSTPSFTMGVAEGITAYQQGDYQTALELWNQASQQGNVDANYHLAECSGLIKVK